MLPPGPHVAGQWIFPVPGDRNPTLPIILICVDYEKSGGHNFFPVPYCDCIL